MELYDILVSDDEVVLIALKSISNKEEAIYQIKNHILKQKFSGTLILDYLIFCSSLDSIDRFIGFKVNEGIIKFNDKYIFSDRYKKLKEISDRYFSLIPYNVIKFSFLKESEKNKLTDKHK
jgi:hypothetical protein